MQILVLPGFSLANKDWAYEAKKQLGNEVLVHEWKHWQTGNDSDFKMSQEIASVLAEIGSQKVNVLAKSIGTCVAVQMLAKWQAEKVILCGIPTGIFEKNEGYYEEALANFPVEKIVIFQNENDPFGKYLEIKDLVTKINSQIKIVKSPRADHNYPYFADFKEFFQKES